MKPTIQGLWIGKIGTLERLSIASFIAHGHDYHLYTYEDQADLPEGCTLMNAASIMPQSEIFRHRKGAAKGGFTGFSNIFRYRLLADKGGWWCDTDIVALKAFDFTDPIILASEYHWLWHKKLSNAVIHCPPEHELMKACYDDAIRVNKESMRFGQCGAKLVKKHAKRLGLLGYIKPPEYFNPINWWESSKIGTPGSAALLPQEAYSVHCYGESWRWRLKEHYNDQFRNKFFDENTLLGTLQHRYLKELS